MEADFKEGDQVLVSILIFNNLKGPKKMRDSFLGPFTILRLTAQNKVEVRLTEEFSRNHPVFPVRNKTYTPQGIVEVEDSPDPVNNIIKARKSRLNGKDHRQCLDRFKNQTADKEKWLAEDAKPDGKLHLRIFRASIKAGQSHQL
ncbi:hypothetical protein O181_026483 [Austropuccinia psidii MF-1]|uniref:Uncharacterized protein n=1 Tax=Austropuccinia psidii MF-1 TaxID=1389203 RepID=A0A9Q3CMN9_9BASI|nr:hypothetical protein [Austropuccinia psidii MF-1]